MLLCVACFGLLPSSGLFPNKFIQICVAFTKLVVSLFLVYIASELQRVVKVLLLNHLYFLSCIFLLYIKLELRTCIKFYKTLM
jgi:hypothetical protein